MQRDAWVTDSIQLRVPIAEGAMGRVWVAYHHRLRTEVAVKFVSEKLGDETAEALARFESEASLASQIKSPHVVQTFDSGVTREGVPYIVMELLHGESLGQRLRRAGRLDIRTAFTVLQHTTRALQRAHALGIVHRDIKPDNIFLCATEDGPFGKVLDFGIAKQTRLPAMGGFTTDGKLVGTPEFMSPELVLEDKPIDYRADLWALAVVMYQALSGQLPFGGATLGQLCLNLVGRAPVQVTRFRPDLPPRVDAWFERALHRDPQQRFGSAEQMAQAFAMLEDDMAFLAAQVTVDPNENTERHLSSTSTLPRVQPPAPRRARIVGAAVAGVALLGAIVWAALPSSGGVGIAERATITAAAHAAPRAVALPRREPAAPASAASSAPQRVAAPPVQPAPLVEEKPESPAPPPATPARDASKRTPDSVGF
jgi:eukaryotic-like serine/threonine-protein kinase